MSFNKITIVGNLGRNPQVRFTPQGQQVCEFSLATNEKRVVNGETKEETTWFQVTLWGKLAEINEYLYKGRLVYVEGRLRVREWTDKEGRQRFALEVNATELKFLGNRPEITNDSDNHNQEIIENPITPTTTVQIVTPSPVEVVAPTPIVKEESLPKVNKGNATNKSRTHKPNGRVEVKDPFFN